MKKPLAITLLILLSSLVTTGIPFGVIVWQSSGVKPHFLPRIVVLAAIVIQTAAFVLLRRLYKTKYGLSSPKFVVCSVLPSAVIPIIGMIVIKCMIAAGMFGEAPEHYYDRRAESEMFCAWTVLSYAVCFAVTLSLALAAVSAIEKRRDCPKKSALMLLAIFGNLLTFVLAAAALLLMQLLVWLNVEPDILGGLAVIVIHIIVSVMVFRRFKRKFGASSGEYVGHGALPAFVISCVSGMLGLLFGTISGADSDWILLFFSLVFGAYSMVYLIGISAVTSFYDPL